MFSQALKTIVLGAGITVGGVLIGVQFLGADNLADIQSKVDQTVTKYNQLKDKYIKEITESNALNDNLLKEIDRANKAIKKANEDVKEAKDKVTDKTKPVIEDDLNKLPNGVK
jgi:predicted  nucleic acid-binding Zn-ribbon protein